MSRTHIEVRGCDRCGATSEVDPNNRAGWGRIWAWAAGLSFRVGPEEPKTWSDEMGDLCPACYKLLEEWWGQPKDLVHIWSGEHGTWWRPNSEGYTTIRSEAGLWTRVEAAQLTFGLGPEKQIAIVGRNEAWPPKAKK